MPHYHKILLPLNIFRIYTCARSNTSRGNDALASNPVMIVGEEATSAIQSLQMNQQFDSNHVSDSNKH